MFLYPFDVCSKMISHYKECWSARPAGFVPYPCASLEVCKVRDFPKEVKDLQPEELEKTLQDLGPKQVGAANAAKIMPGQRLIEIEIALPDPRQLKLIRTAANQAQAMYMTVRHCRCACMEPVHCPTRCQERNGGIGRHKGSEMGYYKG